MVTAPVLRWHGGKGKLANKIVPLLPRHHTYVEPFGGGAAVLLEKDPSGFEIYNDLNGRLVNFFQVLRDRPEDLVRAVELTPYARGEYATCADGAEDPVEDARRFVTASWMSLGGYEGQFRSVTDWRRLLHSNGDARYAPSVEWQKIGPRLMACAQRLRSVQIDCKPALEILADYDKENVLFYLDPPYPLEVRTGPKRYAYEMTMAEHRTLLEAAVRLEGAVVISCYRNELYDQILSADAGWHRRDFDVVLHSTTAGLGQKRHNRIESLWIRTPRPNQQTTLLEVAT
jgi:DNA adenine methylase